VGKIAGLQKGLVWVRDGRALVEEGYGFGCPIVVIGDTAYLSRHAYTEISSVGSLTRMSKHYEIDTVDTPVRFLRRKYRPVPPLGTVVIRYDLHPEGMIDVHADFSGIRERWDVAYLMNEQGARHFPLYRDSTGAAFAGGDIGIWERPRTSIEWACFDTLDRSLSFCVEPEEPASLFYGRERYTQRNWRGLYYLSWSGIDLEIPGPRPSYHYRIVLEAR
jgi:hypothetical protein